MKIRRVLTAVLFAAILAVMTYSPVKNVEAFDPACISQFDSCNSSCDNRCRSAACIMQCKNECDLQFDRCLQGH